MKHLLHVAPGFGFGGAQVRTAQLAGYLGDRYRHTLVSLNGDFRIAERIAGGVNVRFREAPRNRNSLSMIRFFCGLYRTELPDLVLTYNWGSIEAAAAALLTSISPAIHTEDGFNEDEAHRQKLRRVLLRRLLLGRIHAVVAPSQTLVRIMRESWRLPVVRIIHIPNGVDTEYFRPLRSAGTDRREVVIGAVGRLSAVKRYELLIEACARFSGNSAVRLVFVGGGPEHAALQSKVRACGLSGRVSFLGEQRVTPELYSQFDLVAITSVSEQMPLAVLEAMACGLPVVSVDVGDVAAMVSEENRPWVVNAAAFPTAMKALIDDAEARRRAGAANRTRAVAEYGLRQMCERYSELYAGAIAGLRRAQPACSASSAASRR